MGFQISCGPRREPVPQKDRIIFIFPVKLETFIKHNSSSVTEYKWYLYFHMYKHGSIRGLYIESDIIQYRYTCYPSVPAVCTGNCGDGTCMRPNRCLCPSGQILSSCLATCKYINMNYTLRLFSYCGFHSRFWFLHA